VRADEARAAGDERAPFRHCCCMLETVAAAKAA
jgi:hypothetical protein